VLNSQTQPGDSIFIDCGAHFGFKSVEAWESGMYDRIIAFEPSPECRETGLWLELKAAGVILWPDAVWTECGTLDFYENPARPASQSGSVMPEKTSGGIDTTAPAREVGCIDFAEFLSLTVCDALHVHVKMDIEGAEFDVLEHLIATGTAGMIDKLTIEWHATKLTGDDWENRKDRIIAALTALGVEITKSKDTDE